MRNNEKTTGQAPQRLIVWRDGSARVVEVWPQGRKGRVRGWLWYAVKGLAWCMMVAGLALWMWFLVYGLLALAP